MNKLFPYILYFCSCSFVVGSPTLDVGEELVEGGTFVQKKARFIEQCLNKCEVATVPEMIDVSLRSAAWSFVLPLFFQGIIRTVLKCCGSSIHQYKRASVIAALAISSGRLAYSAARFFSDSMPFAIGVTAFCGVSATTVGYLIKDMTHTRRSARLGVTQKKLNHVLRHEMYMVNFWHWRCLVNKIIGREGTLFDYFVAVATHHLAGAKIMGVSVASGLYLLGRRYMEKIIGMYSMALISAIVGCYFYFMGKRKQAQDEAAFEARLRDQAVDLL
jgi:hypothetical protein